MALLMIKYQYSIHLNVADERLHTGNRLSVAEHPERGSATQGGVEMVARAFLVCQSVKKKCQQRLNIAFRALTVFCTHKSASYVSFLRLAAGSDHYVLSRSHTGQLEHQAQTEPRSSP
jgi:hypothetical protein